MGSAKAWMYCRRGLRQSRLIWMATAKSRLGKYSSSLL